MKKRTKKKRPVRNQRRRSQQSPGSGVFRTLHETHPEIAERETRTLTLQRKHRGVPAGEYAFAEAFCAGRDCDCRRTMFLVFRRESDDSLAEHVLTIGYGWEPPAFYVRWAGDMDMARAMKGPALEPNSPPCAYGNGLLEIFDETCLSSPTYVKRVKRHYEIFKEAL